MRRFTILVAALCLLAVPVVHAVEYEKILIPVVMQQPTPGAFGSMWLTRVAILNQAAVPVDIQGYNTSCGNPTGCAPIPLTAPGIAFFPEIPFYTTEVEGAFIYVDKTQIKNVQVQSSIRDLSRYQDSYGTKIPTVRGSEFFTTKQNVIDVPVVTGFRSRLRVYDRDPSSSAVHQVRLRFYEIRPDHASAIEGADILRHDRVETFTNARLDGATFSHPGYIELDVTALLQHLGDKWYRIEIEPFTPGIAFWPLASVTHNATQHVTILTVD